MQFLYPSFLWALGMLAIPIIIHLFYFRRFKKVYFSNTRFLKEIKDETSSRNKLKNLLILLSRLLAIGLLVFAFAQPFLPVDKDIKTGSKSVSIFVDNSFSMDALSEDVPLLIKAKDHARQIISSYDVGQEFQIITHEAKGSQQRMLNREDALEAVDAIEVSPMVTQLSTIVGKQKNALAQADNKVIYLLSDFQKNITDFEVKPDSSFEINLLPFQSIREENVSIDSCWFAAPVPIPNQANTLYLQLTNHSDQVKDDIRISLDYDNQIKPIGRVSIPAHSTIQDTFSITISDIGWLRATVEIKDYPIQYDDAYNFSFHIKEKVKVLSIYENVPDKYLRAAIQGLPNFEFIEQNSRNIQYSEMDKYQLIILQDLKSLASGLSSSLKEYISDGGNVLLFPSDNADLNSYNQFLAGMGSNTFLNSSNGDFEVGSVNQEEFIFDDVFLGRDKNLKYPHTTLRFNHSGVARNGEEKLITYRDRKSFLSKYNVDFGQLFLCSSPLSKEFNDLSLNAEFFIPMLYKMALSSGKNTEIAYTIGRDNIIPVPLHSNNQSPETYKLKREEEFIPGKIPRGNRTFLDVRDQIKAAGFYDLSLGDEYLGSFAFNYDRKESQIEYYTTDELKQRYGDKVEILENENLASLASTIRDKDTGKVLWKYCIILALLFLFIEIMLLRFWKS